ncbi:uncharacterized protein LOC135955995 [Calliphora vicina]|uniref:uncharacterized protein LOC135955995 n=1 Tax=Calliphora vicina TaxID=7373 RepID=UPI00325B9278
MMHANFTLRALHMNFDHISENAKSFSQEILRPPDTKSAGVQDLTNCMANEWLMQLEIQNRVRNELIAKRQEYEDKLILFEQQEEKKCKQKDENKKGVSKSKKPKIAKPTYEPPSIEDDMFPDITELFLKEEQKQYEDFINSIYNPKFLDLEAGEINLKQYFILGGIYQLYEVQKPQHFDFNSFNMSWHYNNSKLVIDENVHIPLYAQLYQRHSRVFKSLTERSLSLKLDEFKDTDPHCPWFVLTIQLPEHLCYWGKPVVCHYETVTKFIQNPVIPIEINKASKKLSRPQIPTAQTLNLVTKPVTKHLPFLKPQKGGLSDSILKLQHPSQESFFRTSLSNVRLAGKDWNKQNCARGFEGVLNIHDFPITTALNKSQIRHMHRYILPRMISSLKFPKEIQEDELKASQHRSKSKAGLLKRKRSDVNREASAENKHIFTFGPMQSNPERIIAIFPPDEPIRIIKHDATEETATDSIKKSISFVQLVKLINSIKWLYKLRVRKIMDLKSFKSKFPITNKRREDLRKSKLKPSVSMSSLHTANLSRSGLHTIKPFESNTVNMILNDSSSELHITECEQEDLQTCTYSHWTTEHILKSEYNREKRTVVLHTNRLGYFGFAFKRYEHFPFKFWKLEPDINDPENKIIFTLDTQYVRCVLYITDKGIKGHVTEPTTKFKRNPKMYLVIEEAVDDLKEFKKIFKEKYLNIFADKDACFYIENGYFSEKHLSTELHIYNCMAVNCTQMKFSFSPWNRLAQRRDIILNILQYQDSDDNTEEVRITPEEAYFVETSELCSDNIDTIKLHYNLTWRNINTYSDLHHLINSMYPAANERRCKNANLLTYLKNLLYEIRPLSFS